MGKQEKKAKTHEKAVEAVEEAVEEALEEAVEEAKEKIEKKKENAADEETKAKGDDYYIYDKEKSEEEDETEMAIEALENVEAERVLMEAINEDYNDYNNYDYKTANMDNTGIDYLDDYVSHDDDYISQDEFLGLDMQYAAFPVK